MGAVVSSSHVVSAAPSSSGGGLLTLFPCSSMGSLPRETVLHKLLQRESFPQAAVLHKLLQRGSYPQGAVLQEQTAPAWVPHGVTSPASKPAPAWPPLSTGPRGHGSTGPARSLLQHGLPTGSQHPSGIHLLRRGVLHGLQVDICSTVDLHGLQGDSLPHHGLHHGCRGISAPAPGASPPTSSPSFFTDFGVCGVVSLTYSQSSLWLLLHSFFTLS